MIIYLLRHAQAQPRASFGSDEDRALTNEGIEKLRKVLTLGKGSLSLEVDRILSSPYKRAIQSAEVAKEILKPRKPKILTLEALEPGKNPYEVYSAIAKLKFGSIDRVMLVLHQPSIGDLASDLVGGSRIDFAPATLARIDGEARTSSGTLVWLLSSDVI
ncbi:MAG: phosphohistidine phosphatase SixA [Nitrososphaerales archaeon]